MRENANWQDDTIKEVYKQANSGGVLLSSMGNPKPMPVYWDKILINASQVTNPSIDPLREPMETKVFLGKKPGQIEKDENGKMICKLEPQLELSMPVMFSAMSYGSISYNAHESLARAAADRCDGMGVGEQAEEQRGRAHLPRAEGDDVRRGAEEGDELRREQIHRHADQLRDDDGGDDAAVGLGKRAVEVQQDHFHRMLCH